MLAYFDHFAGTSAYVFVVYTIHPAVQMEPSDFHLFATAHPPLHHLGWRGIHHEALPLR